MIDGLGSPDDTLWPRRWPPLTFDRPLQVGASGGHSAIRYTVVEYDPGRRVRCAFDPAIGVRGHHEFRAEPLADDRVRVVHECDATLHGRMRLLWPLAIRWLHDALIEDALDNAERTTTGTVGRPHHWSTWVRLLRHRRSNRPGGRASIGVLRQAGLGRVAADVMRGSGGGAGAVGARRGGRRPVAVAVPGEVSAGFGAADLADAYAVRLGPGMPRKASAWLGATFGNPPGWVRAALALRQAAVPLLGIERAPRDTFRPSAVTDRTATVDADAEHLVFRAALVVDEQEVTLATLARAHNRRGRLYLAVVERVHPLVVRSMLRRAAATVTR
ncbi:DUF2867 domain-containing protein [Cryptosporangium japonicum]|uniref:DUF2867 domain-containing protein n=1 Tax=Cryptosporangium japonicum TaxID=80872 RepID=UPI0031D12860